VKSALPKADHHEAMKKSKGFFFSGKTPEMRISIVFSKKENPSLFFMASW
jgi:hypothetical protein